MSNAKDTGGPAFPIPLQNGQSWQGMAPCDGMTLRDYFAAKAMAIMWDAYDKGYCGLNNNDAPNGEIIALASYKMADDMLKAREA
jgi:hypothetical protein